MLLKPRLDAGLVSRIRWALQFIRGKLLIRNLPVWEKAHICVSANQRVQSKCPSCKISEHMKIIILLACIDRNAASEIYATCLPSPLSSARRTMETYLMRGIKVSVQNTNERTPKISSFVSECWMSSAKVLLYTYNGDMLRSPYTTPKLWYARSKVVFHESLCKNPTRTSTQFSKHCSTIS